MNKEKKIFVIGFNKCGTKALHHFFSDNGLRAVHWDNNALALNMWEQISAEKDPIGMYPDTQVFSDMECVIKPKTPAIEIFLHFRQLFDWYPNAAFILNTRSVDRWIISRIYHFDGHFLDCWKRHYGTRDVLEVIRLWRQSWAKHHADVRQFFADKPGSLLEFDLDRDAPIKLCQFFDEDYSLDPSHFKIVGKSNRTPEWVGKYPNEAEAAQLAVLEIDPNHAGAHGLLSLIYQYQGNRNKSLYYAEQACRLNPDSSEFQGHLESLQK